MLHEFARVNIAEASANVRKSAFCQKRTNQKEFRPTPPRLNYNQDGGFTDEKLAEAVRKYPVLYDKRCSVFKEKMKKKLAWNDVSKTVGVKNGML